MYHHACKYEIIKMFLNQLNEFFFKEFIGIEGLPLRTSLRLFAVQALLHFLHLSLYQSVLSKVGPSLLLHCKTYKIQINMPLILLAEYCRH